MKLQRPQSEITLIRPGKCMCLHVLIPYGPAKPKGAVRLRLIWPLALALETISLCFLFIFFLFSQNSRGGRQGTLCQRGEGEVWARRGDFARVLKCFPCVREEDMQTTC